MQFVKFMLIILIPVYLFQMTSNADSLANVVTFVFRLCVKAMEARVGFPFEMMELCLSFFKM